MTAAAGRSGRPAVILAVLLAAVEFTLLAIWQGNADWGFSNGVYAETAREFLHGFVPYKQVAAAQPPPVFLLGALLLAIDDGPAALHIGLGAIDLLTAALVALAVWRLERRRVPALAAGLLAPLVPITLAGHAQLVPETLAAPLVLGGAILCATPRRAGWGALLLALAVLCKVAFVIPALAIVLSVPERRRLVVLLAGAAIGLFGVSIAVFGLGVWREAILAQLQIGRAGIHYVAGLLAQAAWNELPLLAGALAFVIAALRRPPVPRLVRTMSAASLGGLLLALTLFKRGSYIDVLAVAEPPLVVLSAAAVARGWRRCTAAWAVVLLLGALLLAQTVSLLVSPGDPAIATRPFARAGLRWTESRAAVARSVAAARRCPARLAYSGDPWIAFLADRRMPGEQPDLFILAGAREDRAFALRAAQDRPLCP